MDPGTQGSVLLVGGTSGIGLETAKWLVDRSYRVFIAGRHDPTVDPSLEFLQMDVLDSDSVRACFEKLETRADHLHGLVYCSGVTLPKRQIEDFDLNEWKVLIHTNLTGAILCLKYAYPLLRAVKGKVVIINSLASRQYSKLSGFEYTASKAALSGVVRQLSIEWAADGVLINSVFPGMADTAMVRDNVDPQDLAAVLADTPLKRLAPLGQIARSVEFLISPKNTDITGCGIDVSGGQFLNG